MSRSLSVIANEIRKEWKNVYVGAIPYLDAMETLHDINDKYFLDPGREIVLYFLSNATGWRGEKARQIKTELKAILKES